MTRRELCAAASAALVAACNRERKVTLAVIPKGRAHLFWQSVHAGARSVASERGVEIIWNGPASETDYTGQIQIVDAMINRRVNAILLAPIDKKAMVGVVERAAAAKIPVVIFDSGIDTDKFVSQVATDNYAAGKLAATRMGEVLGGKGKVVVVAVQPGAASTMAREEGFQDELKAKFPGIQIADLRYGMADFAKSLTVAENMLTAHPDVQGMFASNESSAVGAAQAVKSRKWTGKLVGFDWSPTLIEDLKAGTVDSLVVQNPFAMGAESVRAALDHLAGKPVRKINDQPPRLIRREDLDKPDVQQHLNPDLSKYLA